MGFLKTILILLLIYFGLRLIWRWVRPYVFRYLQRKAERHFTQAFGGAPDSGDAARKEGEVTIDKMPSSKKREKPTVGQYVDYEEID